MIRGMRNVEEKARAEKQRNIKRPIRHNSIMVQQPDRRNGISSEIMPDFLCIHTGLFRSRKMVPSLWITCLEPKPCVIICSLARNS